MKCVRVRIEGRVQGVGYRDWTKATATRLGLTGWVRNRRDGTVEALFCGDDEAVGRMLGQCQAGPVQARVTNVDADDADGPAPDGFEVCESV